MQITKELRARIERVYDDREKKLRDELDRKIEEVKKERSAEISAEIHALLNDSTYSEGVRNAIRIATTTYNGGDAEVTILNKYFQSVADDLYDERRNIRKKLEVEKETLMITISYSRDLEDIKKVFADFGLDF